MQESMHNNGIDVDPFPKLIWKYHYDFNLEQILPKIKQVVKNIGGISYLEIGDSTSTVTASHDDRPQNWPELQPFFNWLAENVLDFQIKHHNYVFPESRISQSWFNIHKKSGETLEHMHNGVGLVVTCYLQLPPDAGFIEFRDPLEYHRSNTPIMSEQQLWKAVPCTTNDILVFPGWLKHRTQPSCSDTDRIVMTLNIK